MRNRFPDPKKSTYSPMAPLLLKKSLLNLQNKKRSFSLIDLGCGTGDLLFFLKKNGYLKGAKVIGIDIDPKAIQALKKKVPSVKPILSDALNLKKLKSKSFDFVICSQLVEHVEDDKGLILEINRILKKGGLCFITSVLKKWYGLYWYRNKFGQIAIHPDHLREYPSLEAFRNLLVEGGFRIKSLKTYPSSFPLVDYFVLAQAKMKILKINSLRNFYLRHPNIYQLSTRLLFPPIPGYATIEGLAEKTNHD